MSNATLFAESDDYVRELMREARGLPAADPGREERQIARLRRLAEDAELDPEFSEKFLRFIIDEVIRHHEQLRG